MRTRIKICGLTREEDVDAAVQAGADAVGFVLYPPSPRAVNLYRAAELARRLPPFVTPVVLFVNASTDDVSAACHAIPNLTLQFHGDETPEDCGWSGRAYIRATGVGPEGGLLDFADKFTSAQALLLDTPFEGYGGSGKVFDWSLVQQLSRAAGREGARVVIPPLVLSGGLNPANVGDGISCVRPWAVDVSSGVERPGPGGKGLKDPEAIRRFCEAVRDADARLAASQPAGSTT